MPDMRNLKRQKISRGLSSERIGEAALNMLDLHGPAALSARRLAAALGCEAMSLYNHVGSMDEVQDLIVDQILSSLLLNEPKGDPLEEVRNEALRFLALAEAHPHAFALVATRRWRTPGALALASRLVALLAATGLPARDALRQARIHGAYLNGAGLGLASWQLIPQSNNDGSVSLAAEASALGASSVKADLIAGLENILRSIG